jgi:hypothetical protein
LSKAGPSNELDTFHLIHYSILTPRSLPIAIFFGAIRPVACCTAPNRSFVCLTIRILHPQRYGPALPHYPPSNTRSCNTKTKHLILYIPFRHRLRTGHKSLEPCILNLVRQWPHPRSRRRSCSPMKLNRVYLKMLRSRCNKLTTVSIDALLLHA